ncbi:MAG: hypothetical protein ACMG57_04180 [Candidatus Dojkabacteria bacterium]
MDKVNIPNWSNEAVPPVILEMVKRDGLLEVLSPLEIIDYGFKNVIIDRELNLEYLDMFINKMKEKSAFYDGTGKTFQEIYDNVKDLINIHTEQQVLSVDAAGQARSVKLRDIINLNGGNAVSFGVYDKTTIKYYIRKFIEEGKRSTFLLIYHEVLNEPFALVRTIINMYMDSVGEKSSSNDAGVLKLIQDNLIPILNGDLSSLGFDLFAIRREQFKT